MNNGNINRKKPIRKDITFADIIGLQEGKDRLIKRLKTHYKYKSELIEMGYKPSQGMLLFGIPGTGKSMLAEAATNELLRNNPDIEVRNMSAHKLMSHQVGKTSEKISELFNEFRIINEVDNKDIVLVMDEIDSIIPKRGKGSSVLTAERISALLAEIGGIFDMGGIYIIGTTNRPWDIDPAFFRSGRIEDAIHVRPPNEEERRLLWHKYVSSKIPIDIRIDHSKVLIYTKGYTGSDFAAIGRELFLIHKERNSEIKAEDIAKLMKTRMIGTFGKIEKMCRFEIAYTKYLAGQDVDLENLVDSEPTDTKACKSEDLF